MGLAGGEVLTADTYVAAMGSYTLAMLKPLGIELPVYPVKGYSLTLPLTDASAAPTSTVNDETYKVAITRLGEDTLSQPERFFSYRRSTLAKEPDYGRQISAIALTC